MKSKKLSKAQKWQAVDWSQDIETIAAAMGVGVRAAYTQKRKAGVIGKTPRGRRSAIDWHAVDWSQDSETIAAALGISAGHVSKKRLELHGVTRSLNWDLVDWSQDLEKIAADNGRSIEQVTAKYKEQLARGCTLSDAGVRRAADLIVRHVLSAGADLSIHGILWRFSEANAAKIAARIADITSALNDAEKEELTHYIDAGGL